MSPAASKKRSGPKRYSPKAFLRRRRRRSRWMTLAVIVGLVAVFLADRWGLLVYAGADAARYDGRTFRVVAVVDGDTLDLDTPDDGQPTTRVRLWGINTPEKARDGRPAQAGAAEASERAHALAFGQPVTVRLEPHRLRGKYGRLLVYVILPDGTVLNERLLSEGLARADDRWSHRDMDRYAQLERQAQREGRGLWFEPPPDTAGSGDD